jgi:SAM-dependent methyltransferase
MAGDMVQHGRAAHPEPDGRLDAPAFHRNHAPIGAVLSDFLDGRHGDVLELGSGPGQHATEFARRFPDATWWPSDVSDSHLRSIAAWRAHAALPNLRPPIFIDIAEPDWRLDVHGMPEQFMAMFSANVLHIAPWTVSLGLLAGAGRHLRLDGRLFVYGPFRRDGRHNAPSNAAFDARLRADDPDWGVRDTAELREAAQAHRLALTEIVELPANNAILVFERSR